MSHQLQPIDARDVDIPAGLVELIDALAMNVHERRVARRLAEGWRFGTRRDEDRKEDPSLAPYEELLETERDYDRTTALETLKAVISLGFEISRPQDKEGSATTAVATYSPPSAATDAAALAGAWHALETSRAGMSIESARHFGEDLLRLGEPVLAFDYLSSALRATPGDVRLRQLQALALARCGVTERANKLLGQLRDEGHADEETLGLLARTHKDLALRADDPNLRAANLRKAHELYLAAYRSTAGIYSGINAATTALWLGDGPAAAALAREVQARCLVDLDRCLAGPQSSDGPADDPYWLLATLGEAALLLGEVDEARVWYARAFEAGKGRLGDLQSTRRQARLLLGSLALERHALDAAMPMPKVALFCGNEIHRSGRAGRQFSMELNPDVSTAIEIALQQWDIGVGFASAATGADVLFFEALQARRGIAYAVLPFEKNALVADDAGPAAAAGWKQRFEAALRTATQVVAGSGFDVSSEATAIDYAQSLLYGLARIQADALETELVPLTVNDARADGPGTPSTIERWRQWGLEIKVIETPRLSMPTLGSDAVTLDRISGLQGTSDAAAADGTTPPGRRDACTTTTAGDSPASSKIVAILFADVKGFSKLDETQVPRFFRHFLGLVAEILSASPNAPLLRNTWGDGLYLVFNNVRDAGQFALELCERANGTDWEGKGLPGELAIRIALHAGPVWQCNDPVMDAPTFTGTHVSRAARIEPITPSGHVYASQAFAALAAAEGVREMAFEYVGRMPLAKDYGAFPIYHVRRR